MTKGDELFGPQYIFGLYITLLLSNTVELVATNSSWDIADADSVLCALEDNVIL